MAGGPGVYDEECTYVRHSTHASMVAIIVYDGVKGHGFSIQTVDPAIVQELPKQLRFMADQIEADLRRGDVKGVGSA